MSERFINLTEENLAQEHLCCIIRSKKPHPGVEAKRAWLGERLKEGHVFRKLDAKGVAFIEYAALETAWVPVEGENYLYIYCLWVTGDFKGKGYGRQLMEYCLADAKTKGKSGVCMLGAEKQKAWLSDQAFGSKYGFEAVDTTSDGYRLLALSYDGTKPHFTENAKRLEIENQELTIYYCHPYSAYERGSNEKQNRMIRRWLPKGTCFGTVSKQEVKRIEEWLNNYPREILGGQASADLFERHLIRYNKLRKFKSR